MLTLVGLTLAGGASARPAAHPPNIVFVLTDDLDWSLVQYMPHVEQLQAQGTTFTNYIVTDSLCCPSRASTFTGSYPHDTGIFTNGGPDGGFALFHARGEENDTFATRLQDHGYLTAMMGKYLNGYTAQGRVDGRSRYVPPGWTQWDVAGNAYSEFNYNLNENGKVTHHGASPRAYLTDVLARKGSAFVHSAAASAKPFFIEIATFAPHLPYTPAPRDAAPLPGAAGSANACLQRGGRVGQAVLAARPPVADSGPDRPDRRWVPPARTVGGSSRRSDREARADPQAQRRRRQHLHLLQLRQRIATWVTTGCMPGKLTAFETDIHVPLIVSGPGVVAGQNVARVTENVDLYPTFVRLGRAGTSPLVDGKSLVPLLRGLPVPAWRDAALVEHHGPDFGAAAGPDAAQPGSGNPSTYEALRLPHSIYVEYANGEREYYDLHSDPYELTNTYPELSPLRVNALHARLASLESCRGAATCQQAAGHRP